MPPPSSPFVALSATQHSSSLFPFPSSSISLSSSPWDPPLQNPNNPNNNNHLIHIKTEINNHPFPLPPQQPPPQPPQSYFQPPPLFTKSMLTSPPFTSDTNTITAHFLSATALLQKATAVGATLQQSQQAQQAQSMQPMLNHGFDELGPSFCNVGQQPPSTTTTTTTNVSNIDYHHHLTMGMVGSGDFKFATWRKDEDTTRDFLGLTAGDHYTPNNNNNNNTTTTTNNNLNDHSHGGGGGNGSEGGFVVNDDDDDMEGNMLKFTGGLQYGMTASYDRDNSSPSSSSLVHHHHYHHHGEGSFGNFVTSQPPTAAATSDSRWG